MKFHSTIKNLSTKPYLRLWIETAILLVLLFIFIKIYTQPVRAGFFKAQAQIEIPPPATRTDSQKMALLQVSSNIDLNQRGEEENPILGNIFDPDIVMSINASNETNTQISIYTVREGDTLSEIAKMYDVSVNTIMWANDISRGSSIRPGQVLIILPVTGIKYTVKNGDTIKGIVSKYKADLNEVLNYNDITLTSTLTPGQTIIIPSVEQESGGIIGTPNRKISTGYYICPAPGARVTQKLHGHNGVDLAQPVGSPLIATAGGTVIIKKIGTWNGGYGNYIVISHPNGTQSLYAHMQSATVRAGEEVIKGQIVGYIGMSGLTTGPHVHFEIRGVQNPFANTSICK